MSCDELLDISRQFHAQHVKWLYLGKNKQMIWWSFWKNDQDFPQVKGC